MRVRILLLITDLEAGGAPLIVKELACGLNRGLFCDGKLAFDVSVACLGGDGEVAKQLRENSIPVYCLGASNCRDWKVGFQLGHLIGKLKPHILHCHLMHANIVGRIVGRIMGVRRIVTSIHTAEGGKRWHLIAENITCRLSDSTVCVSESVRKHAQEQSHIPAGRLCVINNGVDYDRFANARSYEPEKLGIPDGWGKDKTKLIFVGRCDPVKCIDKLILSVAQLSSRHDVGLLIVGDGPERSSLERLSIELGVSDRCVFMGMRNDVERILKYADIMVMPSRWEGLSVSALEAMACGVPLVANRVPGLSDSIEDKRTGLLVEPGDNLALNAAIEKLITEPAYARQLAHNAQEHIRKFFTLDKMVDRHVQLYKKLLSLEKL